MYLIFLFEIGFFVTASFISTNISTISPRLYTSFEVSAVIIASNFSSTSSSGSTKFVLNSRFKSLFATPLISSKSTFSKIFTTFPNLSSIKTLPSFSVSLLKNTLDLTLEIFSASIIFSVFLIFSNIFLSALTAIKLYPMCSTLANFFKFSILDELLKYKTNVGLSMSKSE